MNDLNNAPELTEIALALSAPEIMAMQQVSRMAIGNLPTEMVVNIAGVLMKLDRALNDAQAAAALDALAKEQAKEEVHALDDPPDRSNE